MVKRGLGLSPADFDRLSSTELAVVTDLINENSHSLSSLLKSKVVRPCRPTVPETLLCECRCFGSKECSGMEAPLCALRELHLWYDHKLSTENARGPLQYILRNFEPEKIFTDILDRCPDDVPHSHIYIAGFPCKALKHRGVS